jgi:electron transfer flavoprotein alpha subunit
VSALVVLVESADGQPDRLSLQALGLAAGLAERTGDEVHAVLIGPDADALTTAAGGLGGHGVGTAYLVAEDRLSAYAPAAWASGLVAAMERAAPSAVVAPGSERGTEILAHVAARIGVPMAANVTAVEPGDRWRVTRQRWAGSLLEEAWLEGSPRLLTVAPHAVAAREPSAGAVPSVVRVEPAIADVDLRARVTGHVSTASDQVSLSDAKVVVGGGRGLGSAEAFAMLDELAGLLGGAVGVSRVATSLGWRPHAQQIGQTGTRIAPDLYIACGISGAIQHIVGAKSAKRILVINTDPDAPIFSRAAYAVVGDVHTVVPAISAEIRRVRGGAPEG